MREAEKVIDLLLPDEDVDTGVLTPELWEMEDTIEPTTWTGASLQSTSWSLKQAAL
jgi:hypothetical protein